jgi:hypothetical protein
MYAALPRPEYYGGSAPPAPSAGVAPIRPSPSWREGKDGTATGSSHVHCCPVSGLGTRLCPCGIATATPQHFHRGLPSQTTKTRTGVPRPGHAWGGYAPQTSPYPPDLSWRQFKRRNNTGSSRIPSRLAHRARPIRQYQADATSSGLLPPSPPTRGSGCPQLHPAAATARRRGSFTPIRKSDTEFEQQRLVAH